MKRGFTIVELLVTVSIIVILSGLLISNSSGSRAKARDAQRISDIAQLQLAIHLYHDRCGTFPAGGSTGQPLTTSTNNGCPSGITFGTFMSRIPTPPSGTGQTAYNYATTGAFDSPTNYILHARLEVYNAVVLGGLSSRPAGYASANDNNFVCSNSETPPVDYCITSN